MIVFMPDGKIYQPPALCPRQTVQLYWENAYENVVLFIRWEHSSYWFVLSQMRRYHRYFSKTP